MIRIRTKIVKVVRLSLRLMLSMIIWLAISFHYTFRKSTTMFQRKKEGVNVNGQEVIPE